MGLVQTRVAFIILDMLVDFFDPAIWPESDLPALRRQLAQNINACLRECRLSGCPVIWVRQAFSADLSDAFPHMRASGRAYTIRGTPGADILPELETSPEDQTVVKSRFSAFFRTELPGYIEELGVDTVILAGVSTSWCIRSTATDAYQNDLKVILYREGMAGFRAEDHERDLAAMNGYIAKAMGLAEIIQLFSTTT